MGLAVVSVCVPALESLAEVIVVLALVDVVAGVSIVGIAIRGRILVVRRPAILSIGLPEAHTLLIAVVHGLPQDVGSVLVCLAIDAAVVVPIRGRSQDVRIVRVVSGGLEAQPLLAKLGEILLLCPILVGALLLLQLGRLLLSEENLLIEALPVLRRALLLGLSSLALVCNSDRRWRCPSRLRGRRR